MRAARIGEAATPVTDAETPRPAHRDGESLIRVAAAAVGHLDRTVAEGGLPAAPPRPYVPCGDGAGHIVRSAVHPPGTLVWVRGGGMGLTRDGLAAEYATVPDEAVHPAPPGTDPALAACFFSPATSALLAVERVAGVRPGERVLVTGGAGAVGSLAVQLALRAGAEVTALVSRPERLGAVPGGARAAAGAPPPESRFDVMIDTTGGPALAGRLDLVEPGGRAVLLGYTAGTRLELDLPRRMFHDVRLDFLNMVRRADEALGAADELLGLLASGELTLPVRAYPLERIADAWHDLADGNTTGRVVVLP